MICMHMAKATEEQPKGMYAEHAMVQGMLWNCPLLGSRLGQWHPTAFFSFPCQYVCNSISASKNTPFKSKLHISYRGSIQHRKHYCLLPDSLPG